MRLYCSLILLILISISHCEFIKTKDTNLIALLDDAVYSSSNDKLGGTPQERIQNRLTQYVQMFPPTQEYLNHIKIVNAQKNFALFINEQTKQVYLSVRGTNMSDLSDLDNDGQMIIGRIPNRVKSVNEFINSELVKYANDGYSTTISGHSLGGSIALISCIENKWISHCEPHNPYLSDALFVKLIKMSESDRSLKDRLLIQRTEGDLIGTMSDELLSKFNATVSTFGLPESVKKIDCHSSLTLIAKAIIGDEQSYVFDQSTLYKPDQLMKGLQLFSQEVSETVQYKVEEFIDCLNRMFEVFGKSVQCNSTDYYDFDSSLCQKCPPGTSCENTISPYLCTEGQYLDKTQKCISCPQGSFNSNIGASSCQNCPTGSVCPQGSESPTPCRKGTRYYNGSCYNCQSGSYQDQEGQTTCEKCPSGHYCPNTEQALMCKPGTYRNPNNDGWTGRPTYCDQCSSGQYQEKPGQDTCKSCPSGHYCPKTDQVPIMCGPGTYRNPNNDGWTGRPTYCDQCSSGWYQEKPGQDTCKSCPSGHYCPKTDQVPIMCGPGTYRNPNNDGMTGRPTYCDKCISGQYQVEPGQLTCNSCPDGYRCPNTDQEPIMCEPGTFRNSKNDGWTGRPTYCNKCSSGYYQENPGQQTCKSCPSGSSCPEGSVTPIPKSFLSQ